MGYKININSSKIILEKKALMKKKLDVFTDKILESVEEKTPEDTRELVGNNQRSEVIDAGTKLVSRVYNDTEYAPYVEYGVKGKIMKYHKPKGKTMIEREGAGMFARTEFELGDQFNQVTKEVG